MKYPRYGKFHFYDYASGLVAIAIYLMLVVVGLSTDIQRYFLLLPILLAGISAWSIYKPHTEYFTLNTSKITAIRGNKSNIMDIPDDALFIIAYADVCPPIEKQIGILKSYFLRDRFSVIILNNSSISDLFKKIHSQYAFRYTNSSVELFAADAFIYSFVCTQEILNRLPIRETHRIIIPESLMHKVAIGKNATVIVDKGF